MYSFIDIIKKNDLNILMDNLQLFDNLSDDEIKNIYDDFEVNDYIKNIISEKCSKRINSLPVDIFLDVIAYSKNSSLFINNYLDRINSFSYNEMVKLIYECYLEQDCLVKILQTDIFQYYLKNENANEPKLKCCWYKYKIRCFCDNIEQIEQVGIEICKLVNDVNSSYELVNDLIDNYLSVINSDELKHQHTQQINQEVIYLINCKIRSHKLLSPEMIKFYILFRVKELNLEDTCKDIIVSNEDNALTFGHFHGKTGTITINYKYLETVYKRSVDKAIESIPYDKNTFYDLINYTCFQMISHEISHIKVLDKSTYAMKMRERSLKLSNINFDDKSHDGLILDYYLKNGMLHFTIGHDAYIKYHNKFIEENTADIFGILDASNQVDKYFKDSFPLELIQNFQAASANRILNFYYSDALGNYKSPLDKFDAFYNKIMKETADNSKYDISNLSGLEKLMLGGNLPDYMLYELMRISTGRIRITSLYSYLKQVDMENSLSQKNMGL